MQKRSTHLLLLAVGLTMLVQKSTLAQPPQVQSPGSIAAFDDLRRGLEGVFRSASDSNRDGPSSPLIDAQTAKGMSLDNQIKSTKTFFQKRELNRMYRAQERGPRLTAQQYANLARIQKPAQLTSRQMDSFSGRINWPLVLQGATYQRERTALDQLFASHTRAGGGINTPEYAQIQSYCKQMQERLRQNVKQISSEQYIYAKRFLESLRYQARSAT